MKNKTMKNRFSKKVSYPLAIAAISIATTTFAAVVNHEMEKAPNNIPSDNPVTVDKFTLDGAMVTNAEDKLVWSRCLVGQTFENNTCTGEPTEFTSWEAALNAPTAEQAEDGWRVPNIKELMRITDNTYVYPATNSEVFTFASQLKFSETPQQYGGSMYPSPPSSPFIWSSTPVSHKLVTKDENFNNLSLEEANTQSDTSRQDSNYVKKAYALDLKYGDNAIMYRDGTSIGENEATQYSNRDPNSLLKARYVLLVKDLPATAGS